MVQMTVSVLARRTVARSSPGELAMLALPDARDQIPCVTGWTSAASTAVIRARIRMARFI
jgi:hypothetical protein